MATAGIVVCSPYGMTCTECNELVIARGHRRTSATTKSVISGLARIAVTRSR